MEWTHKEKTEILKFISQHPFEELLFSEDENYVSQIIGVNYASQEVLMRDFVWYSVEEIMSLNGFKDKNINSQWNLFLESLCEDNGCSSCGYFESGITGTRIKIFECGMCRQQKSPRN